MASKPVDLVRVRRALDELDRIARDHPELCGDGPAWTENDVGEIVMSTPSAERQRAYRRRKTDQGYKRVCFDASPETMRALEAWRADGKTIDEAIREALESRKK